MYSKQAGGCFLVYYATFLIVRMCIENKRVYQATFLMRKVCVQNKQGLLFNLLSHFNNTKNMCLKQGGCFLVYSSLITIVYLIFCREKCEMHNQYCRNCRRLPWKDAFSFLYQIIKNFHELLLFRLFIDFYKYTF